MHKVNRAQQVAANAVLRERIELVSDAETRYQLHKQHSHFVAALNEALDKSRLPVQHAGGGYSFYYSKFWREQ